MKYLPYEPDQAWLLPPHVKDVLGEGHLCFFLHAVVERLDLSAFTGGVPRRGAATLRAGADGQSVVVRLLFAGDQFAPAGATDQGRPALALSGGWGGAGPLDAE